ncbi:MAG: hypothetical protein PHU61_02460 [Candidatus Absconditabacteria bacterium]|nr:hypothetical protein [Candidatus Absconditabacteria bacterium]MDD3868164.1 hypothetical protein [Candidatus Absconditabacteria bacterium]MDD4714550.1 hypothetical protein [Candidatus Absconditabacteria bacterium]
MAQNNEILNRIMGNPQIEGSSEEQLAAASTPATAPTPIPIREDEATPKVRIVTARYKIYLVLSLLLLCFLGLDLLPKQTDKQRQTHSLYVSSQQSLVQIQQDTIEAEKKKTYLSEIIEHADMVQECLNQESAQACSRIPENWNKDLSVAVSFLQLNSLQSNKMLIDEQKVLYNLNDYLIRDQFILDASARNGEIERIEIGDPTPIPNQPYFYTAPVDLVIQFPNVDNLRGFVHNVERKLVPDSANRILYKIQEISYDIIASQEPQTTNISMIAYYYHDPKFEDLNVSQSEEDENEIVPTNEAEAE